MSAGLPSAQAQPRVVDITLAWPDTIGIDSSRLLNSNSMPSLPSLGDVVIIIVVALKFLLPVLYLRAPFLAGWANFLLDSIDGDILVPAGLAEPTSDVRTS